MLSFFADLYLFFFYFKDSLNESENEKVVKRPQTLLQKENPPEIVKQSSPGPTRPKINHHSINPQQPSTHENNELNTTSDRSSVAGPAKQESISSAAQAKIKSSTLKNSSSIISSQSIDAASTSNMPIAKSQLSSGFRFTKGQLIQVLVPQAQRHASQASANTSLTSSTSNNVIQKKSHFILFI